MNLFTLLGLRIQLEKEAAFLIDDPFPVGRREPDVVVLPVGHLGYGLGVGVVHEQVHDHVPVRCEIDLVPDPHREDVLRIVVCNLND